MADANIAGRSSVSALVFYSSLWWSTRMAAVANRPKRILSEEAKKRKRDSERERDRTRINLGLAFTRWRQLKEEQGCKTDTELAFVLLDWYESDSSSAGSQPSNPARNSRLTASHSPDMEDDRTRCTDEESESTSSSEEEFSDDSNDEDYIPPFPVRTRGSNKPKVRRDSRQATGVEKTLRDDIHAESKEHSTNGFSETSILEPVDDDSDDDSRSREEFSEKESEEPTVSRKPKKTYECPTCGRVCPSSCKLKRHLIIHSGQRPFRCFICGRGFTQPGNLKTHMKVHKGESAWSLIQEKKPPVESPEVVNVCKDCGMVFPEKHQLEEHAKTHRLYRCTVCGKTFKSDKSLKVHERVHSEDSAVRCRVCGKRFPTECCLKKHTFVHRAKKKFKCDQCGRAFITSTMLKYHLRSHTGERPHLCSICGKGFTQRNALKRHLQAHTGEKRFVCEQCGKGFIYGASFWGHLKIHSKKPKERTKPLGRPKRAAVAAKN